MRKSLFFLSLCLVLFARIAMSAPSSGQDDIQRVQEQIHALDKDVANFKEMSNQRLDAQDKRIGDLGVSTSQQANYMGAISNLSTLVGVGITSIVTLIAIVAGFAVYFSAKNRAVHEAKEAAQQWLKENSDGLHNQIQSLRDETASLELQLSAFQKKAAEAATEIDKRKTEVMDHVEKAHRELDEAAQKILSRPDSEAEAQVPQPSTDAQALHIVRETSEALEAVPENEFTAEDHLARGLNEYVATRFDSALLSFGKALAHAGAEKLLPERHALLMFARAITLGELGRDEDEIAAYDEIDRRYGQDDSPALREQVAKALYNKGITLGQLDRGEDAIAVYDVVDRRYGTDDSPVLRAQVSKALYNKGYRLGQLGRGEDAVAAYSEVDRRYGRDSSPVLREQVAKALFNKGARLGMLDRGKEAIVVYDEVDRRYGGDRPPVLREQVAKALVNKAIALSQLGLSEDAIAVYDEIDRRYSQDDNVAMRERIARALDSGAFLRIRLAKQYWADEARRGELLALAVAALERARGQCAEVRRSVVLGNLGYALFLSGEPDRATEPTRECLRLDGAKALKKLRDNTQEHRIEPQDADYAKLLDQVWDALHPKG
ncbi:tetratricopeptide repeat protein [Burkholderia alba]|uniref:tetratricopeptide repeat protein n=1 Tax=Burkholderia alba TaxID=2683677 RepID=UPI002B05E18E|nr:hypothetical protein [Burkholderia alba]